MLSGVTQGSVLGLVLFAVFINDLPHAVSSSSLLFADSTKVYRSVTSLHNQEILQSDINCLYEWSVKWLLSFNVSKSNVHYSFMNGALLESVTSRKV